VKNSSQSFIVFIIREQMSVGVITILYKATIS